MPVRKPAIRTRKAKKKPAKAKATFAPRGNATSLELRGTNIPIRQRRATVQVTQERGFNVRTRKVGPKNKKLVI
jgi:hypothetical protein